MNWLFIALCWLVGIVGSDATHCDRIRARGRCREIKVRHQEVIVKFTCTEDAELFAKDLKNLVRE